MNEIQSKSLISIKAPRLWRDSAHLAIVNKKCKDHDDGWLCTLLDNSLGYTTICVQESLGDIVAPVDEKLVKEVLYGST